MYFFLHFFVYYVYKTTVYILKVMFEMYTFHKKGETTVG